MDLITTLYEYYKMYTSWTLRKTNHGLIYGTSSIQDRPRENKATRSMVSPKVTPWCRNSRTPTCRTLDGWTWSRPYMNIRKHFHFILIIQYINTINACTRMLQSETRSNHMHPRCSFSTYLPTYSVSWWMGHIWGNINMIGHIGGNINMIKSGPRMYIHWIIMI